MRRNEGKSNGSEVRVRQGVLQIVQVLPLSSLIRECFMKITSATDASALYIRDTRQTRRVNLHGKTLFRAEQRPVYRLVNKLVSRSLIEKRDFIP